MASPNFLEATDVWCRCPVNRRVTQPLRLWSTALATHNVWSDLGCVAYKSSGEQTEARQPIVADCDAPEVLQPVERALDAPTQLIDTLAEAERLFPVAAIWYDRLRSALVQVFAQLGAVVGFVAEHPFRRLHSANEALCDWAIVCVAFARGPDRGLIVAGGALVLVAQHGLPTVYPDRVFVKEGGLIPYGPERLDQYRRAVRERRRLRRLLQDSERLRFAPRKPDVRS